MVNEGRGAPDGRLRRVAPPLLVVALLLIVWEGYVRLSGVSPIVLPSPSRILGALVDFHDVAFQNTVPTVVETAVGFSVSIVAAITAAIAMDQLGWLRRSLYPLLV